MLIPSDLVMELEPLKAHVETRKKPSNREHLVVTTPFRTKTRRELVKFVIGEAPINRTLAVPATRYKHTLFIPLALGQTSQLRRWPQPAGSCGQRALCVFVPRLRFSNHHLQQASACPTQHSVPSYSGCYAVYIHLNMYTYCTCRCINMLFQYTHVHAPMVPRMHK